MKAGALTYIKPPQMVCGQRGKKATHKCSRAGGSFSGPSEVQGPVSKPNSAGCYGQLNKWFTPHDLFATHLNHKLPLYLSPVPDQNAWDIDAVNINWSGLTAYAYPPTALLHRVIQKIRQLPDHSNSLSLARDACTKT